MDIKELADPANPVWQLVEATQNHGGTLGQILAAGILVVAGMWVALKVVEIATEKLAVAVENMKKLGFSYIGNQELRLAIRRRQQFCTVLRSDLDAIAKAENWNDQWFTDLEAEVEAEGGYYANLFARIVGRRSSGIRRVPSLIQAIHTSAERCMLLVGEPGSGKSVALRHLARAIADTGSKARAQRQQVPLYINLKELPACDDLDALNADYIERFVLQHVRRGDSDTAAYIRDRWQEFKQQGMWFFLFDSFDEIPAVLHSPNGSKAIARHSEAIRQFMDGMGACRGVLASREYKGPEALPWQKLRVLPLNERRQSELIDNTFLSLEQRDLVRRHLATMDSGIFGNPLFISLLCRYICDHRKSPSNDHDLLIQHIARLAQRDPDHIRDQYKVTSDELLGGATKLAVLFAEQDGLSLAPTHDEIQAAFAARKWPLPADLERLLSALIDVKIGRCDVKEARPGDRRFTFSHRRYQETLFVQYLAQHPDHISTVDLLMDSRWREFTVTLIQSQPLEFVQTFALAAAHLLESMEQAAIPALADLDEDLCYFPLPSAELVHLLTLLNEAFSKRLETVPDSLREAISRKLRPRWEHGDLYDKLVVLRYGCLLPISEYQTMLQWAIDSNIGLFRRESFSNAHYLGPMPEAMSRWVRNRFADETLIADNQIELHKLDALATHLPRDLGANIIFRRCCFLRSICYKHWPAKLFVHSVVHWLNAIAKLAPSQAFLDDAQKGRVGVILITVGYTWVALVTYSLIAIGTQAPPWLIASTSALAIGTTSVFIRLLLRAEPCRLTPSQMTKSVARLTKLFNKEFLEAAVGSLVLGALLAALSQWLPSYVSRDVVPWVALCALLVPATVFVIRSRVKEQRAKMRVRAMVESSNRSELWVHIKRTSSPLEMRFCAQMLDVDRVSYSDLRSLLRYVEDRWQKAEDQANRPRVVLMSHRTVYSNLLEKLDRQPSLSGS